MSSTINRSSAPSGQFHMLKAMVGIGILSALMISFTYEGTFNRIKKNKAVALERAIFKVLPGITNTKSFVRTADYSFLPLQDEGAGAEIIYAGYNEHNELSGIAIQASGVGFADVIRILYGYDLERQEIVGYYVLESKETPGLGDKIEKDPDFLLNFQGLDVSLTPDLSALENPVIPVKKGSKINAWEIDGITGATISSKTIGNILGKSTGEWIPLIYKNRSVFEQALSQTAIE